ncbi:endoglin isoform X2 [Dunckerocampus dactyliophorus]|uniref:endoglin isoform X2 n=1 Tax=Dunckerocampus dactyliophorus TaxID=161453 RepID=UPI002404EE35|nr:endoglin isoform X2 [Dunckerocampus dactyliophorus]
MESSALLLCLAFVIVSASSPTCDPVNLSDNSWVYVREMQMGCWTSFIGQDKAEVHILNLNFAATEGKIFSLEVADARPMNLIITSRETAYGLINETNADVNIYKSNASTVVLYTNGHLVNIHAVDFPGQDEELVKWATRKFGGVTSFTTVANLKGLHFKATEGTKAGPQDCILKNEDPSEKHFMKIETAALTSSFKSCFPQQRADDSELHIINIPEDANIRNVSVRVDTKKTSVFLRGPQGTTWTFLTLQHTKFCSNNEILLPAIAHRIQPVFTLSSDKAEDVQRKALDFFKVATFTSYTEIRSEESTLLLVLGQESSAVTPTIAEPTLSSTTVPPDQMPLLMQLYTSPDYRSPLDPNAKVQSDKKIYAEISGNTLGAMVLTIQVISCFVRSKGSCPVVKELPFIPEFCSLNSCPSSTRLSFSLGQLHELTTTWDVECSVKLCYSKKCVDGGRVKRNLEVTPPCQQTLNPPCFDFGLPGVLGIAFGGFLIGVLLIGALWFIKIKTEACSQGEQ